MAKQLTQREALNEAIRIANKKGMTRALIVEACKKKNLPDQSIKDALMVVLESKKIRAGKIEVASVEYLGKNGHVATCYINGEKFHQQGDLGDFSYFVSHDFKTYKVVHKVKS